MMSIGIKMLLGLQCAGLGMAAIQGDMVFAGCMTASIAYVWGHYGER